MLDTLLCCCMSAGSYVVYVVMIMQFDIFSSNNFIFRKSRRHFSFMKHPEKNWNQWNFPKHWYQDTGRLIYPYVTLIVCICMIFKVVFVLLNKKKKIVFCLHEHVPQLLLWVSCKYYCMKIQILYVFQQYFWFKIHLFDTNALSFWTLCATCKHHYYYCFCSLSLEYRIM